MNQRASARTPLLAALLVAASACAGACGAGRSRPAKSPSTGDAERMLAWARLGAEAARRASSACEYYSRVSFQAGQEGRFEPELYGSCVAPEEAALHARIADLSLVAAHLAGSGNARGEAAVRAELERVSSPSARREYVGSALEALDRGPEPELVEAGEGGPDRSVSAGDEGCRRAAAAVVRHIESLAVHARAEALASCPADSELPAPPSTSYLVPASRCGERSAAQRHATAAHALLIASTMGATAEADAELAWVHAWMSGAEARRDLRAPDYAARLPLFRAEIARVRRCGGAAAVFSGASERASPLRRVRAPARAFLPAPPRARVIL